MLITGAGPQLTSLSEQNAPVSMLAKLLSQYPHMKLNTHTITMFDMQDVQVVTNQPPELELALLDSGQPLNKPINTPVLGHPLIVQTRSCD